MTARLDGAPIEPSQRVTRNFHPDRSLGSVPILHALARDRRYRSQLLPARDGYLDPKLLGDAARTGRYEEQALNRVRHCLARFGSPDDA